MSYLPSMACNVISMVKRETMDTVEKSRAIWSKAKTDTEFFAALLAIIKLLKSSSVTDSERKSVFEIIGFSFLKRLIHSDVPDDCPPSILKAVALSILACFCIDEDIAGHEEMSTLISPINEILKQNITAPEDKPLVNDALSCLAGMAKHKKCLTLMLENGLFPTLVNIFCSDEQTKAFGILMDLVIQVEIPLSDENQDLLNNLLANMCIQFSDETSERKFELGELILYILLKYPAFTLQKPTAAKIRETLTNLLQNKLGKRQRDTTIKLAGLMVDKFCSEWFAEEEKSCRLFFVVLVQVTCVEVRMLLEEKTVAEIEGDAFLLTACYRILECIIQTMVGENWFQNNRSNADQLLNSVKLAMTAVIQFLKTASTECTDITFSMPQQFTFAEKIVLATIRVLCSWIAEETLVLHQEVCEVLPFILQMCRKWFQEMQVSEVAFEMDPLRFLMSPLCHLTADNTSRQTLLEHGFLNLIWQYFEYEWLLFCKEPTAELENILITMCGIFLNVVVLESQLVAENDDFFSLLKLLLNAFADQALDPKQLILIANYSVLGLLITKQCYKKVKALETAFYKFLSGSIKFLWDVHHVEEENNVNMFVITLPYQEIWADIMELWFLGMQVLSSLLPLMPWIAVFVAQSSWPTIIIDALTTISPNGIEENIKYTYQALLSSLVQVNHKAGKNLIQHNAITACQKHNMKELEALLLPLSQQ